LPPRRPEGKPKPLPKLSKEAIAGKTPLFSFGELAAFFKAQEPAPPPPPAPAAQPTAEAKPEEPAPAPQPEAPPS
jgi:hypothetical protein